MAAGPYAVVTKPKSGRSYWINLDKTFTVTRNKKDTKTRVLSSDGKTVAKASEQPDAIMAPVISAPPAGKPVVKSKKSRKRAVWRLPALEVTSDETRPESN